MSCDCILMYARCCACQIQVWQPCPSHRKGEDVLAGAVAGLNPACPCAKVTSRCCCWKFTAERLVVEFAWLRMWQHACGQPQ
jgi:hypothetical protein